MLFVELSDMRGMVIRVDGEGRLVKGWMPWSGYNGVNGEGMGERQ